MSFTDLAALASSLVTIITAIAAFVSYMSKNYKNKQWVAQFFAIALGTIALFSAIFAITAVFAHPQIVINNQAGVSLPGHPVATYPTLANTDTPAPVPSTYSALQPGPSCDTNGGIWTSTGISNISCGTHVTPSTANQWGYLYLQLPNNKAFSSNNKINVIGTPNDYNGFIQCIGLDEQDTNAGFLVEYCGDGHWFMYTTASDGTIVQTLNQGLTSMRASVDLSLTLSGTMLTLSIDKEIYPYKGISPIQPTKIAITYMVSSGFAGSITTNNFSYMPLPN